MNLDPRSGERAARAGRAALLALFAALFLGACASSDRLLRLSPLGGASDSRVSLWPLAYHNGRGTSVLWPLFDADDQGFALRPLVANDGARWDLLWPLGSYDARSGNGWFGPFYAYGGSSGLFPLAHLGRFSWVTLAWWSRGAGGAVESGGLFPIARFGETSYVGPAWWRSDRGGIVPIAHFSGEFGYFGPLWWHTGSGGLFPIARFGATSYVGPVWWRRESKSFGVFPLVGVGELRQIGPVWWTRASESGARAGLFPLVWSSRGGRTFHLVPLYSHDLREDSRTHNGLLGLLHTRVSEGERESWVMPLYYRRSAAESEDSVLFPLYWKHRRGAASDVYTLLGNRSVDPDRRSFHVYPLWWSSASETSSWSLLFPLFHYGADGDRRTLVTPLGGRGWSASGAVRWLNVLGPVYHHTRSADGSERRTAVLWPLFERSAEDGRTTTRAAPFFSTTTSPQERRGWYALGLGHFARSPSGSAQRLWPFYASSEGERAPGPLYDLTFYGERRHAGGTERRLFPLYRSKSSGTESEASYLFGLGGISKSGSGTSWRLWPLASHSEHEHDSVVAHWTTLFGEARRPGYRSRHLGGPLLYTSRASESDGVRLERRRFLLLFSDERSEAYGTFVPRGTTPVAENLVSSTEQAFLFGLFERERRQHRVWRAGALSPEEDRVLAAFSSRYDGVPEMPRDEAQARRILAERGRAPEADGGEALRGALAGFVGDTTELVERERIHVPLFVDYESSGDRSEWSGLFGLVGSSREPGHSRLRIFSTSFRREEERGRTQWNAPLWLVTSEREPGRSKVSVLYYGYRSETEGVETRRDIFPFVTWDTAPLRTDVSFLWRVFHYRRQGEKSGGHVLFIPWGDA